MRRSLLVALLIATAVFAVASPRTLSPDVPLPWDMAHHYGGALEIRDAMRDGSMHDVVASLRAPDLYPPGHSLLLGLWLLVAGESATSARLFQLFSLWACFGALWLTCRNLAAAPAKDDGHVACFAGAAAALLLTAPIAGLAATFMVEVPAIAAALLGLASIGWAGSAQGGRGQRRRVAAVVLGVAAPLLIKANIGLPIVMGALAAAVWHAARGKRRTAVTLAIGCLGGALLWAAYLTWQIDGWTSFFAFARNRASAGTQSPISRLSWYGALHARAFTAGWPVSVVMLLLAIWGVIRRPGAVAITAAAAVLAGVLPLAVHPYLLDRNLVGPAAVLAIPCGLGVAALLRARVLEPGRRRLAAAGALAAIAIALIAATAPRAASWSRMLLPERLASLAPASRYLTEKLAATESCRVLGTFNEFSPGWVRILWARAHHGNRGELLFDFAYPLAASRERLDARPDSAYGAQVRQWSATGPQADVVTIEVDPGSAWDTDDYQAWCAWKRNEIAAVTAASGLRPQGRALTLPDSSLCIRLLGRDQPPVAFGDGWGPAEDWGRWCLRRRTELVLRRPTGASSLRLRYTTFEGLTTDQPCSLFVDGRLRDHWLARGAPWQWQERYVPLGDLPATTPVSARLGFGVVCPAFPGDTLTRALPFAAVNFVAAPEVARAPG